MRCVPGEGLVTALMHTIIYLVSPVQMGSPSWSAATTGLAVFQGVIIGQRIGAAETRCVSGIAMATRLN